MLLKVVSFNMKRTATAVAKNHWMRRMDAIRSFFQAECPDIVGTQEMIISYLRKAESMLPEYGWVGEGRGGGEEGEFTAIFYRKDKLRVLNWGTFWLSRTPSIPGSRSWLSLFPRTCTWAIFESIQCGARVCIYNTHLDCLSMFARLNGLAMIRRHIETNMTTCPEAVLMGDFNASPYSHTLALLDGNDGPALQSSYRVHVQDQDGPGRTYHGFRGKKDGHPIDYIFASDTLNVLSNHVDRQTYQNRYPSDHYPVITVLSTQGT